MKRAISPSLNPAGLTSAGLAVYAAAVMITNVVHHHGVIDPPVIVAAIGAVAALLTRQAVTPVADPRDGNGMPLLRQPWPGTARALERETGHAGAGTQPEPTGNVTVLPAEERESVQSAVKDALDAGARRAAHRGGRERTVPPAEERLHVPGDPEPPPGM